MRRAFGARSADGGSGTGFEKEAAPLSADSGSDPAAIGVASHAAQIADLLAAIEEGREPAVDGAAGRAALEIVCAVYGSARTGQPVRLTGTPGS